MQTHKWDVDVGELQPVCEDYTNEMDCILAGCYWYNNSCHSTPEPTPEICEWILDLGGIDEITVQDVFTIIDSYLFTTPPSGYTFIPTLTQVFGVMDYYLGFNGDMATGCNFYGGG